MDVKDFVAFETARKLKEKGFTEKVTAVYAKVFKYKNGWRLRGGYREDDYNHDKWSCISAPTLWQTQKWLREVKGIDITISVCREIDETVSPRIIKRSYECEVAIEDEEDYIPYSEDEDDFPSYEAALSAGIDAALELITNKTEQL